MIAQVNSRLVQNRNDLFRELSQLPAGAEVSLLVERPKGISRGVEVITVKATLSKKYIATSRPSYAMHGPERWRGMLVEYATAVPSELTRGGNLLGRRNAPKLAILAVDPGTPAWNAGVRPGHGLLTIDGKAVESPEDFYHRVEGLSGSVTLQIIRQSEIPETISIPAPTADSIAPATPK